MEAVSALSLLALAWSVLCLIGTLGLAVALLVGVGMATGLGGCQWTSLSLSRLGQPSALV